MGGGEGCHVDHPNILASYNEAQYEGGIKYRGRNILKRRTKKKHNCRIKKAKIVIGPDIQTKALSYADYV